MELFPIIVIIVLIAHGYIAWQEPWRARSDFYQKSVGAFAIALAGYGIFQIVPVLFVNTGQSSMVARSAAKAMRYAAVAQGVGWAGLIVSIICLLKTCVETEKDE